MSKIENQRKQLGKQLRQYQELKSISLLAGSIIHKYNNSIGVIHGYADLALRTVSSSDRCYAHLKQIIEEANAAKELAGKMMIFTRQKKPDFKLVNIYSVVEQAIKILKRSAPALIDIQQDMDAMGATILADADQIQQAVINLGNNAFEAMSESSGTFKITLKETDISAFFVEEYEDLSEGKYVKLTASDTGCGMDRETVKHIFEPFFTTKKAGESAGLGLTVVHEIISGHTGKIIAQSKLGEGTTFDIYLPLANEGHKN